MRGTRRARRRLRRRAQLAVPLDGPYARDDARAYWMGKVVPGADPQTFVVLNANFECTADSAHAYYRGVLIKGFDPRTIPRGMTVTNRSETSLSYS